MGTVGSDLELAGSPGAGGVGETVPTAGVEGWFDGGGHGDMVRSLLFLWGMGTTLFLVLLVAQPPPAGQRLPLFCIEGIGLGVLAVLYCARHGLSRRSAEACAYICYLIVGAVVLVYHDRNSPYAFFYLWLSVHGFYFLPWRRAIRHIGFIAVTYGAALAITPGPGLPVLRWTVTVATTAVICTMVAILRMRVNSLLDRLAGSAATDPLTGLGNRRAFDQWLSVELQRAHRAAQPLALVVGDLDGLKEVNDRLGHQAGDNDLRRLATLFRRSLRQTEPVSRLGGDEFALLLANSEECGAHLFAERLRLEIRREFGTDTVPITASFGIACYPSHGEDAASLFAAADRALYAAKQGGRDQSVMYLAPVTSPPGRWPPLPTGPVEQPPPAIGAVLPTR